MTSLFSILLRLRSRRGCGGLVPGPLGSWAVLKILLSGGLVLVVTIVESIVTILLVVNIIILVTRRRDHAGMTSGSCG